MKERKKPVSVKRFKPTTIVYWFRFGLAIFAGILCYFLQIKGSIGLVLMAIIYVISYGIVRGVLRFSEGDLKGKYKGTILGLGTYVFVWALTWILLYTLKPY
ncbi:hypothetical protein KEJ50_00410 [Candidatus Bathyarchaeota archaeon]|nr:hypothetical protein [Candidatus Bathyarchaeota archaeon]